MLPTTTRNTSNGKIKRLNYVGRLSKEKQPLWALKISEQTKLPIRIYGDGLLKSELQEYASKHKIESDFAGFVSNPWTFFDEGDLLIVPSSFEGDGLVLVEALGNQIPLIANDIPDLRRFQLEDSNYAATREEFYNLIIDNCTRIEHFLPNEALVSKILKERDPIKVAQKWNDFLNSLA
jgi:glycosyltransferase involved in cell wall biosynthesis